MFLSCPKTEDLFAVVSIPTEIPAGKKTRVKLHALGCRQCRARMTGLRDQWNAYFAPEPDITSSLMNVYSRLQNDETLILKGWKLTPARPKKRTGMSFVQKSWLFGGGFSLAMAVLVVGLSVGGLKLDKTQPATATAWSNPRAPLAQFRFEDTNRVKVQYVQPELLQSIEFETSAR